MNIKISAFLLVVFGSCSLHGIVNIITLKSKAGNIALLLGYEAGLENEKLAEINSRACKTYITAIEQTVNQIPEHAHITYLYDLGQKGFLQAIGLENLEVSPVNMCTSAFVAAEQRMLPTDRFLFTHRAQHIQDGLQMQMLMRLMLASAHKFDFITNATHGMAFSAQMAKIYADSPVPFLKLAPYFEHLDQSIALVSKYQIAYPAESAQWHLFLSLADRMRKSKTLITECFAGVDRSLELYNAVLASRLLAMCQSKNDVIELFQGMLLAINEEFEYLLINADFCNQIFQAEEHAHQHTVILGSWENTTRVAQLLCTAGYKTCFTNSCIIEHDPVKRTHGFSLPKDLESESAPLQAYFIRKVVRHAIKHPDQTNPPRSELLHRCGYCYVPKEHLSRCAGCQNQWYCDRTCQSKHWVTHKQACKK